MSQSSLGNMHTNLFPMKQFSEDEILSAVCHCAGADCESSFRVQLHFRDGYRGDVGGLQDDHCSGTPTA